MLGFAPIASAPLAATWLSTSIDISLSGQTISLTQNSVDEGIFATVNVTGFSLALTQESLDLITNINLPITGQTLTATQNNFSITADSVYLLLKQVDMIMTVTAVSTTADANFTATGKTITSALNAVDPYPITYIPLTGHALSLEQKAVTTTAAATKTVSGQTIYTALHSMRMWNKINTSQSANWTPIDTTQSPGWTEIET